MASLIFEFYEYNKNIKYRLYGNLEVCFSDGCEYTLLLVIDFEFDLLDFERSLLWEDSSSV